MDGQLKRGLLEVCVLAAIKTGDSYGYQIIKDMKPYLALSESTLYTVLKRLEAAELLTVRTAEHNGISCGAARRIRRAAAGFAALSIGIVCAGLCIFLFFGCQNASKGILALTKRIPLWVKRRLIRKEEAQ